MRAAIVLRYIEKLKTTPLAHEDQSELRTSFALYRFISPNSMPLRPDDRRVVLPPGREVMRAYINYVIGSASKLDQQALQRHRLSLLGIWELVRQHAPEMINTFLELEARSRRPNEDAPLPEKSLREYYEKKRKTQIRAALNDDKPDETAINLLIRESEFDKARKLIDKISDEKKKAQLIEDADMHEAISLATKNDLIEAANIARRLSRATSMLRVYPLLIEKCIAKEDQTCADLIVRQAVRQLERADTEPALPPPGLPASVIAGKSEWDPILSGFAKLAKTVAPINETLALELLDETVTAANRSSVDTTKARTGFATDVFKKLAVKDEMRTQQAAYRLKDRLRRIVALASIYQWKAEELTKQERARAQSSTSAQQ